MGKTWPAVLAVSLALLLSAGFLFFTVAGPVYLSQWLCDAAAQLEPKWGERLYLLAMQVNPQDDRICIQLAELYLRQQQTAQAMSLLQNSILSGTAGASIYLKLAAIYTSSGNFNDACALLEQAPEGYLSRRVYKSRPAAPQLPAETELSTSEVLTFSAQDNALWYRLDGGAWVQYQLPISPAAGEHTLSLLAISPEGIPSEIAEFRFIVSPPQPAGWFGEGLPQVQRTVR